MGEEATRSSVAALLAISLCGQGRYDEAERYAARISDLRAENWLT